MAKMTDDQFAAFLDEARKRVASFDQADGHAEHTEMVPKTAALAIRAGLGCALKVRGGWLFSDGDVGRICDAIVYLEQLAASLGYPTPGV